MPFHKFTLHGLVLHSDFTVGPLLGLPSGPRTENHIYHHHHVPEGLGVFPVP